MLIPPLVQRTPAARMADGTVKLTKEGEEGGKQGLEKGRLEKGGSGKGSCLSQNALDNVVCRI